MGEDVKELSEHTLGVVHLVGQFGLRFNSSRNWNGLKHNDGDFAKRCQLMFQSAVLARIGAFSTTGFTGSGKENRLSGIS
jgi:hypothetical protein